MKVGVFLRNMGPESTRSTIRECALSAEELAYDSLFVVDHLAIPVGQTEGSDGRYLDALMTLGFLAGVTQRIRIGVGVLVVPYRAAVLSAKQIATLQVLCDERLIFGAGVGWMRAEFEALGVASAKRGALTDETLAVIHQLFSNDVSAYHGKYVQFPEFVFSPRPKRPPIWIGGGRRFAIARTLAYGDGYFPSGRIGPDEARAIKGELAQKSSELGRRSPQLILSGTANEDPKAHVDELLALQEAGVDHYILSVGRYQNAPTYRAAIERFAMQVLPALSSE